MSFTRAELDDIDRKIEGCSNPEWVSKLHKLHGVIEKANQEVLLKGLRVKKGGHAQSLRSLSKAVQEITDLLSQSGSVRFDDIPADPSREFMELINKCEFWSASKIIDERGALIPDEVLRNCIEKFVGIRFAKFWKGKDTKDEVQGLFRRLVVALRSRLKTNAGFGVNEITEALDSSTMYLHAPFHCREAALILVQEGADVLACYDDLAHCYDLESKNNTLLHCLFNYGRMDKPLINAVIKAGCPVTAKNSLGHTFLDHMSREMDREWAAMIYKKHAERPENKKSKKKSTATD